MKYLLKFFFLSKGSHESIYFKKERNMIYELNSAEVRERFLAGRLQEEIFKFHLDGVTLNEDSRIYCNPADTTEEWRKGHETVLSC